MAGMTAHLNSFCMSLQSWIATISWVIVVWEKGKGEWPLLWLLVAITGMFLKLVLKTFGLPPLPPQVEWEELKITVMVFLLNFKVSTLK